MAKSGVTIEDEVTKTFEDIKTNKKHRWMLMRITPEEQDKRVEMTGKWEKTTDQEADFEALRERLMEARENKQCRYAVIDLSFSLGESGKRNKLCFILWAPDDATVRERMVYTSTEGGLKDAIGQGISQKIQANDPSDLLLSDIIQDLKKSKNY